MSILPTTQLVPSVDVVIARLTEVRARSSYLDTGWSRHLEGALTVTRAVRDAYQMAVWRMLDACPNDPELRAIAAAADEEAEAIEALEHGDAA